MELGSVTLKINNQHTHCDTHSDLSAERSADSPNLNLNESHGTIILSRFQVEPEPEITA